MVNGSSVTKKYNEYCKYELNTHRKGGLLVDINLLLEMYSTK
jgi:hypothetical protein